MELLASIFIIIAVVLYIFAIVYACAARTEAEEATRRASQALAELDIIWRDYEPAPAKAPPAEDLSTDEDQEDKTDG